MLTPKNIKAKTAIEYFKQGYYQKGKWLGKGAVILGLFGEIKNHQVYDFIVQGLSPDGSKRLNKREVHWDKRKAAVDCTFAAPKSVSLCAVIGGDERLIQAHQRVVEKVLREMESRYAQSRVMLDSKTQEIVKTGNLVIAKYDHIESRELDPHLHSHCLVMNMTQLPNGEWYSHLNDEIFRNQKLLGMMYQHYLAIEVQKLGYEIELLEHGQFDIKGYSVDDLNDFSKRRAQILASAGVDANWLEREKAWSKTRRNKENVAPEELRARWQDEAAALGIEIVRPGAPKLEHQTVRVDEKIFADAIKYCSERQVAFRAEDIEAFILAESKPLDIASVEPLINSSDQLIRINEQNGLCYTTIAAVERELATINLMKAGQGKVSAIAQREIVKAHLDQSELNSGQQQAVLMALTTSDSFVAWQGVAGAGKTFALKEVLSLTQKLGYSVKGFAPSSKASNVLGQELNAETQTVARLLASKPPKQIEANQIWIVDEAGLLSALDAYRLLQRATSEQARVILVGDTKQLSAVEAGNPFKSLQQAGIACAYLNESQRQKNSPHLKLAIDLLAQGRVEAGFARLNAIGCIQNVAQGMKTEEIVQAYFKANEQTQAKTLVLAGTNQERIELTAALRGALQAQGRLGGDVLLTQLKSKDLREVQLGYTSHFAIGDMVMPLRDYKRKKLFKGELFEVVGRTTDTIKVKAADGRQLEVNLNFKKAVFSREEIEIAVGDRLMWKKNNHPLQRVNGNEVKVLAINGSTVHVQELSGKEHILDLNQPHHLDHAIVRTTYSSQGETADRVLVAADFTIGKESFYVAASRARMELCFFTSDQTKLLEWATSSRAQENPLEVIKNSFSEQISVEQLVGVERSKTTPQTASQTPPQPITHTTTSPAPKPSQKSNTPPYKALAFPSKFPIPNPVKRTQPKHEQTQNQQITPPIPRPVRKPIPSEPFWTPTPAGVAPSHFEQKHWHELVEGSAINPLLASRNVRSLGIDSIEQEHEAWEYLMYSARLERTNTGRLSSGILKHYQHIEHGGWWASAGIDARSLPNLQLGEKPRIKLWGCFKPDQPRVDVDKTQKKGETVYIKYEHPLKEARQLFLFDVPDTLAQRIYDKYGVQPTEADLQSGFWYVTYKYNLPITLAEGAKKTLSSLSLGEITIGLSGVNGGYYANDLEQNRLSERILHPELEVFATRGRKFSFAFDQDTKQSTVWNVRRDMVRTGELLELEGCSVDIVQWEANKGKGLDDLIVNSGALAYQNAQSHPIPLALDAQKHYTAEYVKLSKKVLSSQSALSCEAIDIEVYKLASLKGDIRDGTRTISQSDLVRSFKDRLPKQEVEQRTLEYIGRIEQLLADQKQLKSEQTNDLNNQRIKPELADTADTRDKHNPLVDRKADRVGSKQDQADGEAIVIREQLQAFERNDCLLTNQPQPDSEQLGQKLAPLDNSPLPERLQQLQEVIDPQHKHFVSQQTTVQPIPQVFMGSQPQQQNLQPIQNHGAAYKPIGGLWTSPYQPQYGSEWSAFVQKEGMTVPPHKQQLWLVVPKPDLKILVVDSPEKLKSLPHLPPRIVGDNVCPIDYEAIASIYDALVIKPQMLRGSAEVATFDVESTIWFGSNGYPFASVEPLKLPLVHQQVSQSTSDFVRNHISSINSKNLEQPLVPESETTKNLTDWKQVVIALGKPQAYINRVAATTKAVETGLSLPENVVLSMQQDFQAYQQISSDLTVWYDAAKTMGKSEQYLSQIKQVAITFRDPCVPTPLSPKVLSTMQQDLQKHEQLQMQHLWQHYSLAVEPVRPMMKANAVAHAALIDGHPTELIYKILKYDPQCAEIRQRSGEQAVQNHLKVSLQSALSKMQQQNPSHQAEEQHQCKQQPGFEL